ncbi:TRAP transporter small permease [Acidaminobacter hydrogenoformans]|uniref:TRAP-type C4-dicarboxylate transport system, small permease component n=1 Tax=Acidaminobacter hydrogenoformans DSM 2784 TaxID=1120920 RepID=A0A1G5RZB5_9FIRM|nr:TRAP transporter small permease [Acidaminobacter hydrogenoformans]SCZ79485.1 TRAP-type C4-dicarboxylate transport system, small permease component [Acidaminobacter hydrogenoformans DSM 2784]
MRIIRWLDAHFEEVILTFFLYIMVAVMGYQVVMRYLFNNSVVWSEELTRYLFVWSAFVSIGYCIKKRSSIKIDQIVHLMPKVVQKVILLLTKVVSLFFFVYLLRYSFNVVQATIKSGQLSPALQMPMVFVHLASIVGFAMAIVRILESFVFTAAKNVEE